MRIRLRRPIAVSSMVSHIVWSMVRVCAFDLRCALCPSPRLGGATDVVSDVAYNPLHPQIVTACYDGRVRFYTCA